MVFLSPSAALSQIDNLSHDKNSALSKVADEMKFSPLDSLINSRRFVFEADFLESFYGGRISVLPKSNFIKIDSLNGTLRTGADFDVGFNGVSGVTAEGKIGYWKLSKNPDYRILNLRFNILATLGSFDITLTVSDFNRAKASINGPHSASISWQGHIRSLKNSEVPF